MIQLLANAITNSSALAWTLAAPTLLCDAIGNDRYAVKWTGPCAVERVGRCRAILARWQPGLTPEGLRPAELKIE
jgi:hypothetical protein